jgi:ANTAR domain
MSANASTNGSPKPSRQVSQAVGMISVQADCVIDQAFTMLSECAFEMNRTLDEVAVAVMEHRIRFDGTDRSPSESNCL